RLNEEEGGDDVKSVWPLRPGLHTYYNARHNGKRDRQVEQIPKNRAQFRLSSATRRHEAGTASNGASATAPGIRSQAFYTPSVTSWKPFVPAAAAITRMRV